MVARPTGRCNEGKKHGGDEMTGVDGLQVKRVEDLISYVEQHKSAGDKITLSVYRNGQTLSLQATLQQRPFPYITIL